MIEPGSKNGLLVLKLGTFLLLRRMGGKEGGVKMKVRGSVGRPTFLV